MKTAKRVFALMLAVLMVAGLCTTAFATNSDDPSQDRGSITIANPQEGETYTAYRIFDLAYDTPNPYPPKLTDPMHTHSDANGCYIDAMQLICDEDHAHDFGCYTLTCGDSEHLHQLLDPTAAPGSDDNCYSPTCGNTNTGHVHTIECYDTTDPANLACTKTEHLHKKACYTACTAAEHTHSATCYPLKGNCEIHAHDDLACYAGITPNCGDTDPSHVHDLDCYAGLNASCGKIEHKAHTAACYDLTAAPDNCPNGGNEHTHNFGCYTPSSYLKCQILGNPYSYSIDPTSPFFPAVSKYILDKKAADPNYNGFVLDPVYGTEDSDSNGINDIKAYNIAVGPKFDPADFAAYMKKMIDEGDSAAVPPITKIKEAGNIKDYRAGFVDGKAEDLPFGYYLVEPSTGALCTLTSTDPDVTVSDKNEAPPMDKVIVTDENPAEPQYVDETDPKYTAYQLFQKNSRWEWGDDINAEDFVDAAMAYQNPTGTFPLKDAFLKLTYNDAQYSDYAGDSAAEKWYELYKDSTYKTAMDAIFMTDDPADGMPDYVKGSGKNALNKLTPGATYLVKKDDGTSVEYGVYVAAPESDDPNADPKPGYLPWGDGFLERPALSTNIDLDNPTGETDTNSGNVGDTINYKLTTKVPDMTGYKTYFFVVNDLMDGSLTFMNDVEITLDGETLTPGKTADYYVETRYIPKPSYDANGNVDYIRWTQDDFDDDLCAKERIGDIKTDINGNPLYRYASNLAVPAAYYQNADGEYLGVDGKVLDPQPTDPSADARCVPLYEEMVTEIRIVFNDMVGKYWSADKDADKAGAPIVITYSAYLNSDVEIDTPNSNTANVTYSNNPNVVPSYEPGEVPDELFDPRDPKWKHNDPKNKEKTPTGEGPSDTTNTYAAEIELTKTDDKGNILAGAKFGISGLANEIVLVNREIFEEAADGIYYKLKNGTYTLDKPSSNTEKYVPSDKEHKVLAEMPLVGYYYMTAAGDPVEITEDNVDLIPAGATIYTDAACTTKLDRTGFKGSPVPLYYEDATNGATLIDNTNVKNVPADAPLYTDPDLNATHRFEDAIYYLDTSTDPGTYIVIAPGTEDTVPANAKLYKYVPNVIGMFLISNEASFASPTASIGQKFYKKTEVTPSTTPVTYTYEQVNLVGKYYSTDGGNTFTLIDLSNYKTVPQNAVFYDETNGVKTPTDLAGWLTLTITTITETTELKDEDQVYELTSVSYGIEEYDNVDKKYNKVLKIEKDTQNTKDYESTAYVGADGKLVFAGLGEGTYTIEELVAPDGYNKLTAPITVKITFVPDPNDPDGGKFIASVDDDQSDAVEEGTNTVKFNVVNKQGVELPETGGIGTYLFYTIGGLLVVAAGVLLITKKRMHAGEVED